MDEHLHSVKHFLHYTAAAIRSWIGTMGFSLRITRFMLLGPDATLEVSIPICDMIYSCMILDNLLEQVKNIFCQLAFSFVTSKIRLWWK